MNKIIYTLICGVLLCSISTGCRNYVEIPPENLRILQTTSDYQSLLYYGVVFDPAYTLPIYSGDDAGTDEATWQNTLASQQINAYTWADRLYGTNIEDPEWKQMYNQIFNCNTVIDGVMASTVGTQQEKQLALSDALVQRAYNYYTLVNEYALQYDLATASSDLGLPLVLDPKFNTSLVRASVQKTYDQIKADLNQALPGLPNLPDFITNPSKAGVYAMLARVCLNTREFAAAEQNANLALSLQNTLLDLNTYAVSQTNFPTRLTNPEQIFYKKTGSYPPTFPLSATAISLFDPTDLRFQLYTADKTKSGANFNNRSYFAQRLATDGVFIGLSVPEMMLIKAECEARAGSAATAIGLLNDLRKKRFKPADYKDLVATTADAALRTVIDEREREFIGRGFRWFDQKRLSKDAGLISTVTRTFKGVAYTIQPGSNRYTYAIADKYIQLNPEIKQNPR
jgi:hypothetical protein